MMLQAPMQTRFGSCKDSIDIKEDDKLIQAKGVESLTEADLHKACRARGIHVAEDMCQQREAPPFDDANGSGDCGESQARRRL